MTREEAVEILMVARKMYPGKSVIRDAFTLALSALRPVSLEKVEKAEWIWSTGDVYTCSSCGEKTHVDECMGNPIYNFCPFCMAPITDEAVEMVMKRMEALHEITE